MCVKYPNRTDLIQATACVSILNLSVKYYLEPVGHVDPSVKYELDPADHTDPTQAKCMKCLDHTIPPRRACLKHTVDHTDPNEANICKISITGAIVKRTGGIHKKLYI